MAKAEFPHYIEFRHVNKTFDKPVLVDCNFHIDAGETVAIIGRSGVGKSVSLAHIMGFLKPDSGQIIVAHEDITHFSEAEMRRIRKKVTMVFQSGALFDSMTVGENIEFSLELRDDYDEQNKEDVVEGLLGLVGLDGYRDVLPSDLSTG
jgi:phospholipid/cholesterol/gamma-HCH transport system ATP-binding protein